MARVTPDYDFKHKDISLKSLNIVKKIIIDLPITTQASSFTTEIYNEGGNYNSYFDYHDDIKIYLGYESEGTVGVFHGRVEKLGKGWKPSGSTITISGRGTWALMMEKFDVTSYTSTELGAVLKDLISNNVPGLTTTNVGDSGITPDVELIDHAFINDKVTEYCKKAGFDAWVDFDDDLHFTGTPGANSVSLTAGENIEEIELHVDWKKIRNYIRCYGKKIEDVQLIKTEEDTTSQGKYGTVMKILKQESLDESSLVQSIVDAALLEDKEAEWGGMAIIPGDERIEPAKSIPVYVPALDEDTSYKVQHVKHIFETRGKGFQTTVMLVGEEADTARFYKELYEKTGKIVDFSNAGNYEESYVYKFTDDQDSLLTLTNCYTDNSTLKITDKASTATCQLTAAIVGDANYSKCLPYISQQYGGANKFYVSNDGGNSWEQVYNNVEHTFASDVGDKNDFKFKIELSARPALEVSSVGTDKIYGIDTDYEELWNFDTPDSAQEIWGLGFGEAMLWMCENNTGKIYKCNPEDGSSLDTLIDKAYTLGGCTYHPGTGRLFVLDRTNDNVIEINTSTGADQYTHDLPGAISDPTGINFDGTNFWIADKTDDKIYRMTTAPTADNAAWDYAAGEDYIIPEVVDPYDMAWDGTNLRVVCADDGKVHRLGYGTAPDQSWLDQTSNTSFGAQLIIAQSFQVSMPKDCSSVEIYLKNNGGAGDLTCLLCDDDAGEPGSILKTKVNSGVSTSLHWEKFTWASPQALSAAITYWFIVKATDSSYSAYQIRYNLSGGYESGQVSVDYSDQYSDDLTTETYKDSGDTTAAWIGNSEVDLQFEIRDYLSETGSGYAFGGQNVKSQTVVATVVGATEVNYVKLVLKAESGTHNDITIELHERTNGRPPGNILATGTIPAFSDTSYQTYTCFLSSTVDMTRFVQYWLVIKAISSSTDAYAISEHQSGTSSDNNTHSSTDGGASYGSPQNWNYSHAYMKFIDSGQAVSLPTARGNSIHSISYATLTVTDSKPGSSSIAYYMSACNGAYWESITPGVQRNFVYRGSALLWKAILTRDGDNNPKITALSIDCMGGATETWIGQDDDLLFKVNLDDILYDIDSFTPPGGTPRGLTYRTEFGESYVYTLGAYLK